MYDCCNKCRYYGYPWFLLFHADIDGRPDPRPMASWFKNPLTEIFDFSYNLQHDPICGKIELGMVNCLEAYGLPQGFYRCRDHMDDYYECITFEKRVSYLVFKSFSINLFNCITDFFFCIVLQWKRCKVMRRERQRQHRDGEREIKYAMPPKAGSAQL